MAEIQCPICHRTNDASAERCWYCQAVLPHEAEPAPENGDWLDGLRGDSTPTDNTPNDEPAAPDSEPPAEEVPEWLARIRELERQDHGQTGEPEKSEPTAPEPQETNWQDIFKGTESPAPEDDAHSASEANDQDEWLKSLQNWQPQPNELEESAPAEEAASSPFADEPQVPSNEPQPNANEENPDWLSSLMAENTAGEADHLSKTPAAEETSPFAEEPAPVSEPQVPEAISKEHPNSAQESESAEAEKSENWLSSFRGLTPERDLNEQVFPPAEENESNKNPFSGNAQEWMEEAPVPEESGTPEEPVPQEKLEPASLPAWIQALSPNHKAKPSSPSATSESSGPLAGIEGALNGEDPSKYYSGPQTFSSTLKVTENQLGRAQILKNIAEQAHWEDDGIATSKPTYRWVLRLIVTLILLATVLLPMLVQSLPVIAPTLYPDEVVQFYNTLSSLNSAQPVLIAADFDGSLYGELKWSMQPVLQQLLSQQVPLAYVSTNPEGAVLLQKTFSQNTLANTVPTFDLGYLAGGSVGLQTLAQDPRTAFPLDASLNNVWNELPMSQVKQLSDFGAVIVITENADTARYWIEQVQPVLGNVPMLVIVAAQSAPLLQPYYDSGQISGYLSGLGSAVVLETLQKAPGAASGHLGSFQYTSLLVAALIIIGGIVSLILYKPAGQRSQK